jgi:type IV pilus assembly protein PilO
MMIQQHELWNAIQGFSRDAPMAWPAWMRHVLSALVSVAVIGMLWFFWLSSVRQDVLDAQATHVLLRAEFSAKLLRVAPLTVLQSQQSLLERQLTLLERKLPGPHEMGILLSDMSRAGRLHNLRIELLRPADMNRQLPYSQQSIALRVSGRYQDLAGFAADLAGLNWLLSIQSFSLVPTKEGALLMDAIVHTLRPLGTTPNANVAKVTP